MSFSYSEAAAPTSVGESLSRAWTAVKANIWLFAGFTLLFFIAFFVVSLIPLLNIVAYLFSFVLPVSVFTAAEAADGGREIQFSDFFAWTPRLSRLLVGMLVKMGFGLLLFLPFFLTMIYVGFSSVSGRAGTDFFTGTAFIVVSLIMTVLFLAYAVFSFSMHFLLLKTDLSLGEVIKLSWKTGWSNLGNIILFGLLCLGLYLLGTLALLVGLLVTFPLMLGTQYFFLRSRFPDRQKTDWDFDATASSDPYSIS